MSQRASDGPRRRNSGRRRSPGQRDHYAWWEYALMLLVVVLILGGAIALFRMVTGSSEPSTTPTPATTVTTTTASTSPAAPATAAPDKVTCEAGTAYDDATNTCRAAAPVLSGVSPTDGSPKGGTELTITGQGFTEGATVTINDQPGVSTTVVDAQTITTTTPPSTVYYPVDVAVTNPDGQSDSIDNVFTYNEPKVKNITEIVPSDGSTQGGETVTIKGVDFQPGAVVSFFGRPATDVEVVDASTIRVTIPAAPAGSVVVNVRNPGQDPFTAPDAFTYVDRPPRAVTAIDPREGSSGGGTKVTITGSGFDKGADVSIGGRPAAKVKILSSTRITAVTPAGKPGAATVAVRNPGVPAARLIDAFTYVAGPAIAEISPASGPVTGGTKVTITGTGFDPKASVTFGNVVLKSVTVVNESTIRFETPAAAAPLKVDVTVTNPGEPPATLGRGFAFTKAGSEPAPSSSPSAGASTGSDSSLPRCPAFTSPKLSTDVGSSLILTDADLFPSDKRVARAVLTGVTLKGGGSVSWQASPSRIEWTPAGTTPSSSSISYTYTAAGCRGTGRAVIAVSAR